MAQWCLQDQGDMTTLESQTIESSARTAALNHLDLFRIIIGNAQDLCILEMLHKAKFRPLVCAQMFNAGYYGTLAILTRLWMLIERKT